MKEFDIKTTVDRYTYGNGTTSICVKTREMNMNYELSDYASSEDEIEKMKQAHLQFFDNMRIKQIAETEEWNKKKEKEAKKAAKKTNNAEVIDDDFSEELDESDDDFKLEED